MGLGQGYMGSVWSFRVYIINIYHILILLICLNPYIISLIMYHFPKMKKNGASPQHQHVMVQIVMVWRRYEVDEMWGISSWAFNKAWHKVMISPIAHALWLSCMSLLGCFMIRILISLRGDSHVLRRRISWSVYIYIYWKRMWAAVGTVRLYIEEENGLWASLLIATNITIYDIRHYKVINHDTWICALFIHYMYFYNHIYYM